MKERQRKVKREDHGNHGIMIKKKSPNEQTESIKDRDLWRSMASQSLPM